MNGYRDDLAYIHESGFAQLADGAASALMGHLPLARDDFRTVIDLGCGGGTLAKRLHEAGYDVIGYDISEAMIRLARSNVPEATFVSQSFVDVAFPPCVAVTAIGEVFNYLFDVRNDENTLKQLLDRIIGCLCPGGVLLFDVAGLDRAQTQATQSFVTSSDWTVLVTTSVSGHTLTREIISFRRVNDLYRRSKEKHRLRLIEPATVSKLLLSSGFEIAEHSEYNDQRLPRGLHAFVARKPVAQTE